MAWSGWAIAVTTLAGALWLSVSHGGGVWWVLDPAAPLVGCSTVGVVLVLRVQKNPIGWLFLGSGLTIGVGRVCDAYSAPALGLPGARGAAVAAGITEGLVLFLLPALLLLFPEGRLPSPRWRPVAMLWVAVTVTFLVGTLVAPGTTTLDSGRSLQNPLGIGGIVGAIAPLAGLVALLVNFALMMAAAVSLLRRYRRATGYLRQQLKWFGAAAAALALVAIVGPFFWALQPPWSTVVYGSLLSTAGTALVIATGVAILRYRLYEIDVIVRRTLIYATLVGFLALVYLGGIYVVDRGLQAVSGQSSALAVTVSTLTVAAGFQPLRRRIQSAVDHRFYRGKYDAARTMEEFTTRLRDQIELDVLSADVLNIVQLTLKPSHATLWLRPAKPVASVTANRRLKSP